MESVGAATSVWLSRLGKEKRNGAHQHFYSQKNLFYISAPLAHFLRLVNKSSSMPQVLFTLLLLCYVSGHYLVFWLFKAGTWFPIILWLSQRLDICFLNDFQSQMLMGTSPKVGPQCQGCPVSSLIISLLRACDISPICH